MYHRFSTQQQEGAISSEAFAHQIAHIAKNYTPVSMATLAAGLRGQLKLQPNTVAVTVDDGYLDFYEIARPILKKNNVPATLYVTTGFVDGRTWLWPDQIAWLLDHIEYLPRDLHIAATTVCAGPLSGRRKKVWDTIVQALLTIPDVLMRDWIRHFAIEHKLDWPFTPPTQYSAVTWDMLREMQDDNIEIGAHSLTHPSLGQVSVEVLVREITGSVSEINCNLGDRSRAFCYPNGTPSDCPKEAKRIIRAAGCHSAVTAFFDRNALLDLYALRRYSGAEDDFSFMKALTGVEWLGSRLWGANNIRTTAQ